MERSRDSKEGKPPPHRALPSPLNPPSPASGPSTSATTAPAPAHPPPPAPLPPSHHPPPQPLPRLPPQELRLATGGRAVLLTSPPPPPTLSPLPPRLPSLGDPITSPPRAPTSSCSSAFASHSLHPPLTVSAAHLFPSPSRVLAHPISLLMSVSSPSASPKRLGAPMVDSRAKRAKTPTLSDFTCDLCHVSCNSNASFGRHLQSAQHKHEVEHNTAPRFSVPLQRRAFHSSTSSSSSSSSVPARQRLVDIVAFQWGTFAEETVQAMFALRHRPLVRTVSSRQLASAPDIEQYCALALSAPLVIASSAQRARDALACSDLPRWSRAPTVALSPASRARLQYDCLHRRFLTCSISQDVSLLHVTVQHCVAHGLAPTLLSDELSSWIADIALTAWYSAQSPDNPLHRLLHRPVPERGVARVPRCRSLNDLQELDHVCECLPSTDDEKKTLEALQHDLSALRIRVDSSDEGSDIDDGDFLPHAGSWVPADVDDLGYDAMDS